MRTTIDLDEDVLLAVKDLAKHRQESIGRVVSDLTRRALVYCPTGRGVVSVFVAQEPKPANKKSLSNFGIHPFPYEGGEIPTNELVNRLREEEGI